MNANELRNGNIIQSTEFKNPFSVDYQNIGFVMLEPDKYEFVKLSAKWFEKFGFRYLKSGCWEYGCMRIYDISDTDNVRFRIAIAGHQLVVLKYVHELQNFHFVFTKKELV